MIFDLLIVFIMLTVLLFIFILYYLLVEESPTLEQHKPGQHIGNWRMATALIIINMIFLILVVYGFFNMEWFYVQADPGLYGTAATEGDVYAYVFVVFFFIHILLLFKCGWDSWMEALNVKGRMKY